MALEVKVFDTWGDLQELVESRWGLSPEQRQGAFCSMRPSHNEMFKHFMQCVKDEHTQLHLDDELCLHTFWPLISPDVQQCLDLVHMVHMTILG